MTLEVIELTINFLNKGDNESAIAILQSERDRLIDLRKQNDDISVQKAFEKYMLEPGIKKQYNYERQSSNVYSYENGLFSFGNGISLYRLKNELIISEEMKDSEWTYDYGEFFESEEKEIENYVEKTDCIKKVEPAVIEKNLEHCEQLLGDKKLLVEFESRSVETKVVIYESGVINHAFSLKQIDFMETFLGKDATVYISAKTPVAYAESDKGKGYVLGYRT